MSFWSTVASEKRIWGHIDYRDIPPSSFSALARLSCDEWSTMWRLLGIPPSFFGWFEGDGMPRAIAGEIEGIQTTRSHDDN